MLTPSRSRCAAALAAVVFGLGAGCAGPGAGATAPAPFDDANAPARARLADLERLGPDLSEADRERAKRVAWRRAAPPEVRVGAIDALLADDEADTRRMLALLLPTETAWPVIERVSALAGERGWADLTPALVRSWSRSTLTPPDAERPERAALAALHPDETMESVVFAVFADRSLEGDFAERTRSDAWGLLRRIDTTGERSVALLRSLPEDQDDALVGDIRAAAIDLLAIPETTEQLEWVRDMRRPEHEAFWREATAAVASLNDAQRAGLRLRHAAIVRWAAQHRAQWLAQAREALVASLEQRLTGRSRHERTGGGEGTGAKMERPSAWRDDLAWGDALALLVADEAAHDPSVVRAMFEQADADHLDHSTEHGGVLDAVDLPESTGEAFEAIAFPPRPAQRTGDRRFATSPEMLRGGAAALFHYHFHANRLRNAEFAGPSEGDLLYARDSGRACLVLTFIDERTLGVDYYQPGGARIDLGTITRP